MSPRSRKQPAAAASVYRVGLIEYEGVDARLRRGVVGVVYYTDN